MLVFHFHVIDLKSLQGVSMKVLEGHKILRELIINS